MKWHLETKWERRWKLIRDCPIGTCLSTDVRISVVGILKYLFHCIFCYVRDLQCKIFGLSLNITNKKTRQWSVASTDNPPDFWVPLKTMVKTLCFVGNSMWPNNSVAEICARKNGCDERRGGMTDWKTYWSVAGMDKAGSAWLVFKQQLNCKADFDWQAGGWKPYLDWQVAVV